MRNPRNNRRRSAKAALPAALLALLLAVFAVGCGGGDDDATGSGGGGSIHVVGYSTPEAVYEEALEPGFEATPEGEGVSFSNSFGASGDQSRAVEAGQPASVVHFAQGGDMIRVVESGAVAPDWNKQKFNGIAQNSVVVLTVRQGNPEGLKSLDDVLSKDVEVITPNPFSSGAARWNIMAVYGSQINAGKSEEEALAAVKTL